MTSIFSYAVPVLVLLGLGYALGSFRVSEPVLKWVKLPAITALGAIAIIGFAHGTFAWLMAAVLSAPLLLGIVIGTTLAHFRKSDDDCGCPNKKQEK
jgi:hypothetical protein